MPKAANRIFVSIAVSQPRGDLDELPGAIHAAERMAEWATKQGYATVLVHDRAYAEVTVDLLRDVISKAIREITDQTELERLVVFFVGHGAALAVGDQYWILTHWKTRPTEAIKVSSLQRMLEYYGPRQVAMIGDACQEFSARFIDVIGSSVLDKPDEELRPFELDQFFAVDVGKQAYMVKATDSQEAFCVFTAVLLVALSGEAPPVSYELINDDLALTSQSLARYLDRHVALEAGKYGMRMVPRLRPGFFTDRVYLRWQAAAVTPTSLFPPPAPPLTAPYSVDGSDFECELLGESDGEFEAEDTAAGSTLEETAPTAPQPAARTGKQTHLLGREESLDVLAAASQALQEGREAQRAKFAEEVSRATTSGYFETECGVCISGTDVARVEASFGGVTGVYGQPGWFSIRLDDEGNGTSLGWSDTLVTLANGRICAVCVIQDFVASLHVLGDTALSLFHRGIHADRYDVNIAINLLARAHSGLLKRQEIINSAAALRQGKHQIITLGCIAAQFYDIIRDVDSLRAMASFYALNRQPVPLDIVLYGGGRIFEQNNRLYAQIPATAKRSARTIQKTPQRFTFEATPGFERYPIAGRVPWMRHAWGAIATASCDESAEAWRRHALAVVEHLAPGAFTSVFAEGRKALVELSAVEVRQLLGANGSPL